jgi:hypothetical protein
MPRGRPRKHDPSIPGHIDQTRIPAGILWDRSGKGRWYVRDPHPDGFGFKARTVAGAAARLSDLHAIAEARAGGDQRGTLAHLMNAFRESTEFNALAKDTRRDYDWCRSILQARKTRLGSTWDQVLVDKITPPNIQRLVEALAKGDPGNKPTPAKANHVLRYLRRLFAWGIRLGYCSGNPATGVRQAIERAQHQMPSPDVYTAVLEYARIRGARQPHSKGSSPPYLWPLMELDYLCRLRGIEGVNLTDAHATSDGLRATRVKGSRDNITRWNPRLSAAWAGALTVRAAILAKPRNKTRPVPMRPEYRAVFLSEDGTPLTKSALDTAWQNLMRNAIEDKVISPEQRFTLHGLKHRGITDSKDKASGGHKTLAMQQRYDHEVPVVEPSQFTELSGELSGAKEKGT